MTWGVNVMFISVTGYAEHHKSSSPGHFLQVLTMAALNTNTCST